MCDRGVTVVGSPRTDEDGEPMHVPATQEAGKAPLGAGTPADEIFEGASRLPLTGITLDPAA